MVAGALLAAIGCRVADHPPPRSAYRRDNDVARTALQDSPAPPLEDALVPLPPDTNTLLASYLARALAENRTVHATRLDVLALRARIPQVSALDDPMVQNGMWPFPSNGPQFALMGYMPYELMISQQFPWLGTLRLRGCVAEQEARIALWRLAEAQLAVVADVKRAYFDAQAAEHHDALLANYHDLGEQIVEIARARLVTGGNQQDVLRAEVAVTDIERQQALVERDLIAARAELARQMHAEADETFRTSGVSLAITLPDTLDHLTQLAIAARPNLQADLAAIERGRHELALARKRYWPNFNVGVGYTTMTRENNPSPLADGRDNLGFALGFNLPIYRTKLDAGVREAEANLLASTRRYESDRDEAVRATRTLIADAQAQQRSLELLRDRIAPKSRLALQNATAGYRAGTLDFVTLNTARQELLDIELEVVRAEAEFAKALADLERAVGLQLDSIAPNVPANASQP